MKRSTIGLFLRKETNLWDGSGSTEQNFLACFCKKEARRMFLLNNWGDQEREHRGRNSYFLQRLLKEMTLIFCYEKITFYITFTRLSEK